MSIWSNMQFKSNVSLLIFFLDDIHIVKSVLLAFPALFIVIYFSFQFCYYFPIGCFHSFSLFCYCCCSSDGWVPLPCLWVLWFFLLLHLVSLNHFTEYLSLITEFFSCVMCLLLSYLFPFLKFSLFMYCYPDLSEHLYNYYFELFIR